MLETSTSVENFYKALFEPQLTIAEKQKISCASENNHVAVPFMNWKLRREVRKITWRWEKAT